jgi:hypothetical protein
MADNPWSGLYADPDISNGLGRNLTVNNRDSSLVQQQKQYLWNIQQGQIPTQWANTAADGYKMRADNKAKGLTAQILGPYSTLGTMGNYSTMDQWNNQNAQPVITPKTQVASPLTPREANSWGNPQTTLNVCPTCGKPR